MLLVLAVFVFVLVLVLVVVLVLRADRRHVDRLDRGCSDALDRAIRVVHSLAQSIGAHGLVHALKL